MWWLAQGNVRGAKTEVPRVQDVAPQETSICSFLGFRDESSNDIALNSGCRRVLFYGFSVSPLSTFLSYIWKIRMWLARRLVTTHGYLVAAVQAC